MQQVNGQGQICVNARVTAFAMGGQQRVATEIMKRLPSLQPIMPKRPLSGLKGHAWEQLMLPASMKGRILWSPSATGPLAYRNQVVTIHDTAFIDHPEHFAPSFVKLHTALIPRLVRRVAAVVTVSQFSRRSLALATGISPERIQVIYNGVADHFKPYSPAAIAHTRTAMGLPERYVLCQATADKRKNLAGTIEAWRAARPSLPADVKLVIAGHLDASDGLGRSFLSMANPDIHYVGYVDDAHMGPLMAGAEVFLFPSLYEGFGLPIIEAMAAGTPVISGDTTAMPEVAGDAAWLVNASDPSVIAEALVALVADKNAKAALRAKGLARAKHFSWDQAARDYQWTFQRLAMASVGSAKASKRPVGEHAPWP